MPSSFSGEPLIRRTAELAAIIAIAAVGTWGVYRHTLEYGFDYDDYQFTKPFTSAEIRDAFTGPWDRTGIQVPFYRPLTIAFYAARFEAFGLNSRAHHALSLVLFSVATVAAGVLAWRMTGRASAGALAAVFFVVHPSMPYAQAVWPTNQMHLLESLVVLGALWWWNGIRGRPLVWWLPLLAAAIVAFLIKEDGIMLLPVIVVVHWLRRWIAEPQLPPPPRTFIVLSILLIAVLVGGRTAALAGLGGYGRPTPERALRNFVAGLDRVFRMVPPDRPWQTLASWFATLAPLVALASWRRVPPHVRFLLAAGFALAVLFNLPFVFVTKLEQMHLVALGAVLVLAASIVSIAHGARGRGLSAALMVCGAAGAVPMAFVARDISTDFAPFGPIVRAHDQIVQGWAAVPHELREYLSQKDRHTANPADGLEVVIFGAHPRERNPSGLHIRWMSSTHTEILVAGRTREAILPLRHAAGVFREPAYAEILANGRRVDRLELADGDWRVSRVALRAADIRPFWRMHRIVITLRRAWVPAQMFRRSTDTRVLGLQIGDIQIR